MTMNALSSIATLFPGIGMPLSRRTRRYGFVSACLVLTLGLGGVHPGNPRALAQSPPPALRPIPRNPLPPGSSRSPMLPPLRSSVPMRGVPLTAQPVSRPTPPVSTHQRLVELASGHPVCLVVGEGLASEFVGTVTVDEGPFKDYVMGAMVQGVQKTRAKTGLDFTPSADAARMLFVLKGVTENDTVAQVQRASVHSAGTFEFEMTKQIEFNGYNLRTWSPSAFMKIRQQNLDAASPVSNVPLLGPLAKNIILNVADQRKPVSEGIAAQRVTQQVAPQFNSKLDDILAKLNEQLHGPVQKQMGDVGMLPSQISTTTTQDALLCGLEFRPPLAAAADASGKQPLNGNSRVPTKLVTRQLIAAPELQYAAEPGLAAPTPYSLDSKSLRDRGCVLIHASFVEDLVERFHLAGREITDTQLMRWLGTPPADVQGNAPQLYTILLAEKNPLFVIIDDGEIFIEIHAGIRPVVGPELPVQMIQIAVRPQLTDEQIVIKPTVYAVEAFDKSGVQSASPLTVMIQKLLEQHLPQLTLQRNYEISRQQGRASFPIRIQSLTMVESWLSVTIETPGVETLPRSADASGAADEEPAGEDVSVQ